MDNHVSFGNIVFGLASAQHSTGFVGCAKIIGVTTGIQKVILPSDNIDTKYNLNGTISNDNNGIKIIKCKNGQYKKIIEHSLAELN